jgi:hypothetical protein
MLSLCDVVAVVESNRFNGAIRFEPGLYGQTVPDRIKPPQIAVLTAIRRANFCSFDTARMIFSTSFGRFQLLGETLYGEPINLRAPISAFWASEAMQLAAFNAFVAAHGIDCTINELLTDPTYSERFATAYNGPGNVADYAGRLISTAKLLNGQTEQAPLPVHG